MAQTLFRAAVVLMLCCTPALAMEKFANEKDLMAWVTSYYQHPEPNFVDEAFKDAHELGILKDTNYIPVIIGFFAGVFETDKDLRRPIAELNYNLPQVERHAILRSLHLSSKNEEPAPLLAEPLERTPLVVDMLWGYFYATGDEAAVKRVIGALPWSTMKREDANNDQDLRWEAGASAKQTLVTNAAHHQRVMEICKKELPNQPPEIKPILQEVISQAEGRPAPGA